MSFKEEGKELPANITNVVWSAENLPSGVVIDKNTGIFNGTPSETGEYVIPVHVETNYGTDTKDVKIIVTPPAYNVFAIGANAQEWSENAEPDEYGFYPLNMPKAYKLMQHYNGFGAKVANGDYYCCGTNDFNGNQSDYVSAFGGWQYTTPKPFTGTHLILPDKPNALQYGDTKVEQVITDEFYDECNYNNLTCIEKFCAFGYLLNTGRAVLSFSVSRFRQRGASYNEGYGSGRKGQQVDGCISFHEISGFIPEIGFTKGLRILNSDKQSYTKINFQTKSSTTSVSQIEIGYKVKKLFYPRTPVVSAINYNPVGNRTFFYFLSEDNLLDNNPEYFPFGTIRDAWSVLDITYVVTDKNKLYTYPNTGGYNYDSSLWEFQGIYDVKKLIIVNAAIFFILTNDGKLYHKGNARDIPDVTEEHTDFTQIFPDCYFYDIAYSYEKQTLTVIKE